MDSCKFYSGQRNSVESSWRRSVGLMARVAQSVERLSLYTITRKSKHKNTVSRLYKCRSHKNHFTATVGTIFDNKWFAAIYTSCVPLRRG